MLDFSNRNHEAIRPSYSDNGPPCHLPLSWCSPPEPSLHRKLKRPYTIYHSTNIGDYKGSEQILTSYSIDADGNITYSSGTYSDSDN